MKRLFFFCLLFMQCSTWAQSDTARFVIRTYGFQSWDDYDAIKDSIATNWDIMYLPVAGCVSTTEFTDSINNLNNITSEKLITHYGSGWKKRFNDEVDVAYTSFLYKKEHTFREIAYCVTKDYAFKALENVSQTQIQFTVVPKKAANLNNNEVRIIGLQNRDHTILYRGLDNRITLEFGSFADPISSSIKSKGKLQLLDSCPASTKIQLGYRPQGSVGQDTILVETTDGKIHEFIFNLKNLAPPGLYFNEQLIDSTMNISKFYTTSVLSMHYDKNCLVPARFNIHTWEISYTGGKKPLTGGGNIIPMSVIRKLRKSKPGAECCILVTVSTPDSVLRKKIVCFTLV